MRIALAKLLLEKPNLLFARRAYQPLGSRSSQLAGAVSHHLSICLRPDFSRSLFSGCPPSTRSSKSGIAVCIFTTATMRNTSLRNRNAPSNWKPLTATSANASKQLEAFINRFRYQATKAKQVQSRIKELD